MRNLCISDFYLLSLAAKGSLNSLTFKLKNVRKNKRGKLRNKRAKEKH